MKMTERTIQRLLFYENVSRSKVCVPNYTPPYWYECDFFQITEAMHWVEFEIKTSVSDFFADLKKVKKHQRLAEGGISCPRRFWYVVTADILEKVRGGVPDYAGLIVAHPNDLLKRIKKAPIIGNWKCSDELLQRIYVSFYHRFWNLRVL